jgi:hypothetical protein
VRLISTRTVGDGLALLTYQPVRQTHLRSRSAASSALTTS